MTSIYKSPLVSIVMPVYNSQYYLRESIESILNQNYTNFEFIIVNDYSTDKSKDIILEYKKRDSRIVFLNNLSNNGNYYSRNIGNKIAKGEFIAIMDSDDIAMYERIAIQVEIMKREREISAIGCDFYAFSDERTLELYRREKNFQKNQILLLKNNVALHSSLMIRHSDFRKINYYDESFHFSSDYDMLCKLSTIGQIVGIDDILMKYRIHENQISSKNNQRQSYFADIIRLNYFTKLGFRLSEKEYSTYNKIMKNNTINYSETIIMHKIINLLRIQNKINQAFNIELFNHFLNILKENIITTDDI